MKYIFNQFALETFQENNKCNKLLMIIKNNSRTESIAIITVRNKVFTKKVYDIMEMNM